MNARGTGAISLSGFAPRPHQSAAALGSDVLEPSRFAHTTLLCLCTDCLFYSENPSPSSLGRLSRTVSLGDTSRKSTGIPQSVDASPLCARARARGAPRILGSSHCLQTPMMPYLPNSLGARAADYLSWRRAHPSTWHNVCFFQ